MRQHTQLAPVVCRLVDDEVLFFGGQHTAAAQIWAGRQAFDCKIYVDPELRRLKEANLSADDKLRFFSHKVWEDPDPELNDLRHDNAERAKDMLSKSGLTPGWILGGEP